MKKKIISLILVTICCGMMLFGCSSKNENLATSESASEAESYQEYSEIGLYDKLKNKERIEVLVLGDSIGANSGATEHVTRWDTQFITAINKQYGSEVGITNLSVPGTGSLFGIVKLVEQEIDLNKFDLAVVCYGHNDGESSFDIYYEALIRYLKHGNANLEILPILESSQKDEATKVEKFKKICEYYELDYADTIAAFETSGKEYDALVKDGIHPNDDGYALYATALENVLTSRVEKKPQAKLPESALSEDAGVMNQCEIIPLLQMENNGDVYTASIETVALGTYYLLSPEGGKFNISVNGNLFERDSKQDGVTMESYELLYRNPDSHNVNVEISMDKTVEGTFYGIFAFTPFE